MKEKDYQIQKLYIQFAYLLRLQFELRRSAETVTNNGYSGPGGRQLHQILKQILFWYHNEHLFKEIAKQGKGALCLRMWCKSFIIKQ